MDNRRIYVLPTPAGLFFAALVLAMSLGALNYGNNPALLLALLLAGAGLASALAAHLQLSGLVVTGLHATPVQAGHPLQVQVVLQQQPARTRAGLQLQFDDHPASTANDAHAGQLQATCALASTRRGLQVLPPLSISTVQPLGLVRAWTRLHPSTQCLVHPMSEHHGPALPPPANPTGHRASADGCDEQLRDYRPGDSRARIAWKASAHRQGLLVRQPTSGGPAPCSWIGNCCKACRTRHGSAAWPTGSSWPHASNDAGRCNCPGRPCWARPAAMTTCSPACAPWP